LTLTAALRVSISDECLPAGTATPLNPPLIRGEASLSASGWDFPLAAIDRKGITLRGGRRPLQGRESVAVSESVGGATLAHG